MDNEVIKIELLNVQSEEIQEVVGKEPPSIIRWGMTSIFGLVLLSLFLTYIIEYNETIVSEVKLIAKNPPAKVLALTDGRVKTILVAQGTKVSQGDVIGYLETVASVQEVYNLKQLLINAQEDIKNNEWKKVGKYPFNTFTSIGELQSSFEAFIATYLPLKNFLQEQVYDKKQQNIYHQLLVLNKIKHYLDSQRLLIQKDYTISVEDFKAKSILYNEKVIPFLEYQQEKSKLLLKESPLVSNSSAKASLDRDITLKYYELTELDQELNDYKLKFIVALNSFIESIKMWEKQYIFKAPVSGVVDIPTLLFKNKYVKSNEEIVSIQQEGDKFYGEALLNQQNFGKIKLTQQAFIKVDGYPFQEFGKLAGKVSFIAKNANETNKFYIAIALSDNIETDKKIPINIQNGMTGTMEIITKRTRLLNRIIYSLTELIDVATHKNVKK